MTINELLAYAREEGCSDVHITHNSNPVVRKDGVLVETEFNLSPEEKKALIFEMINESQRETLKKIQDLDFCYSISRECRHRVNIYRHEGNLAAAIRIINNKILSFSDLKLPETLRRFADEPRGLVLVTGPTGSGKSTTLAAMIDYINETRPTHILTIEDPIEYVYNKKRAVIHQREIGEDVQSFSAALRSAMREDPDVILVGEMRDFETISAAITAAETGHLVFGTLHTMGAADTIDRIIDVFPAAHQQQIRTQLASTLRGIVTQTLIPKASGKGRVAAFEIMVGTDAVLNLIRENKCHQLTSTIQTGGKLGMVTLTASLAGLVRSGEISMEDALTKAKNREELMSSVQG